MDLLATRLIEHDVGEKGHELDRGMARGSFAQHLAGLGVEGAVQGERAVAVILKTASLKATGRERAAPDLFGQVLEYVSFHPRRRLPRERAGSGTAR